MAFDDKIRALEQFCLDHYDEGGHWLYETHEAADWIEKLTECGGDLEAAKADCRAHWKLLNGRDLDCGW